MESTGGDMVDVPCRNNHMGSVSAVSAGQTLLLFNMKLETLKFSRLIPPKVSLALSVRDLTE